MKLNNAIEGVLKPAYEPCVEFGRACTEMRWQPQIGHVPRGFLGGAGDLHEVELVLVFAEPGDPHENEQHTGLQSAYEYAIFAHQNGKDLFHRNVRNILNLCWPDLSFEQQMHKAWLTESVLCSAREECGAVSSAASRACGQRYLLSQLQLFPRALVVALGGKAQSRLRNIGFKSFISVFAAAPPGCNSPKAQESWRQIPIALRKLRESCA